LEEILQKRSMALTQTMWINIGLATGETELQGLFMAGNLRTEISGVFGGIESENCKVSDKSSNNFP